MRADQIARRAAAALLIALALTWVCAAQKKPARKQPAPARPAPAAPAQPAEPAPAKPALDCGADLGSLDVRLHPVGSALKPPASLLLSDASGDKAGVDASGKKFTDIMDSSYELEGIDDATTGASGPKSVVLRIACQPDAGEYTLEVIGTSSGEYELEVHALDVRGEVMESKPPSIKGSITAGAVHRFLMTYPASPGVALTLERQKTEAAREK
ncbi:MAG TPA: hypothetical protein VFA60_15990 [Terriglobales bacterium]|nr:hypothetical protein [Terriglobales bacterium]